MSRSRSAETFLRIPCVIDKLPKAAYIPVVAWPPFPCSFPGEGRGWLFRSPEWVKRALEARTPNSTDSFPSEHDLMEMVQMHTHRCMHPTHSTASFSNAFQFIVERLIVTDVVRTPCAERTILRYSKWYTLRTKHWGRRGVGRFKQRE